MGPSLKEAFREALRGLRMLRRNLAFTGMAALSLTVGIGASAAAFGVFNGLF